MTGVACAVAVIAIDGLPISCSSVVGWDRVTVTVTSVRVAVAVPVMLAWARNAVAAAFAAAGARVVCPPSGRAGRSGWFAPAPAGVWAVARGRTPGGVAGT